MLAHGDDAKAARWFKGDDADEDTVQRLRALLPDAGESQKACSAF